MALTRAKSYWLWATALLITVLALLLVSRVNINDNALDLLPGEAVRGDLLLLKKLGLMDRIIITLSLDNNSNREEDYQALKSSTRKLGNSLTESPHFTGVLYTLPHRSEFEIYQFIQQRLPLYLSEDDMVNVAELTTDKGIEKALLSAFTLLNSPAGYGMQQLIQQDPLGITALYLDKLNHLRAEYAIQVEDGLFHSNDKKHTLLIAESKKGLTDADSAREIETLLQTIFTQSLSPQIKPMVIGSLPHTLANANAVRSDLKTLLPLATILLLTLLLISLRSIKALLVLAIPFLAAPPAIIITAEIYQNVSALALGFGIVLLGIAVDFAIHLYFGLASTENQEDFLKHIRRPILLATLTTGSVFTVLLFSQVPSHRQMATLALAGIVLAVTYAWFLIPSTVKHNSISKQIVTAPVSTQPSTRSSLIKIIIWSIFIICGLLAWPHLSYNGNLQTLDAPNTIVLEDEKRFRAIWGQQGDQVFVVITSNNLDEALQRNYKLYQYLSANTSSFQSVAPILPSISDQQKNSERWKEYWQGSLPDFQQRFMAKAVAMGFSEKGFLPFFQSLQNLPAAESLLDQFPPGLKTLASSMIRLPQESGDQFLLPTTLTVDNELYSTLLSLEKSDANITLLANKKWRNQVEKLLKKDILVLSLAAALVITLIIVVNFRSFCITLATMAPVISALAAMILFSAITGRELNMMHLLMGIMVIGLAVDYGIFVTCAHQWQISGDSLKAISICAMSSLIGFGALSLAHHPALNSLGITVLVGIGTAWPTAIIVSPAMLNLKKGTRDHAKA